MVSVRMLSTVLTQTDSLWMERCEMCNLLHAKYFRFLTFVSNWQFIIAKYDTNISKHISAELFI